MAPWFLTDPPALSMLHLPGSDGTEQDIHFHRGVQPFPEDQEGAGPSMSTPDLVMGWTEQGAGRGALG